MRINSFAPYSGIAKNHTSAKPDKSFSEILNDSQNTDTSAVSSDPFAALKGKYDLNTICLWGRRKKIHF